MSGEQDYENSQNEEAMEQNEHGGDGGNEGGPNDGEDDRKLFVGGLSWETKESDLQEYMSKFGKVKSCNLKKDIETNRSRGFGFVVFEDAESVEKALKEPEHKLQGKTIDPKRANPKGRWQEPPIKKIYVAKVSPSTTEEQIKEYFSQWGKVEKIDAPVDKEKDQRRNFVFVEFDSEETVNKVLNHVKENPDYTHKIGSDEIEIKKATPGNRGRGRGGFFRGGDRGGRGGRGGYGGYGGGWNDYNQGYGGYGNGYGYGNYGGYNYGGYDPNYGYGGYGGGWGGYDQNYYGYGGYGGYDYSGGWGGGYGDQSGQQSGYGKAPKSSRGGSNSSYRPY